MNYRTNGDGGNSSYKVIMQNERMVARKQLTLISELQSLPQFEEEPIETLVANLHKNIVVHVTSPAIKDGGLFAIGTKSQKLGKGRTMSVTIHDKSSHDFTGIMPLGMIATQAVQDYFKDHGELPATIDVETNYVTALPVVEYTGETAKAYENRFTKGVHIIQVFVATDVRVVVNITVTDAKAVQEGVPAIYALVEGKNDLFAEYNRRYNVGMEAIDLLKRKVLLVDIGDGTTEFIYVVNGRPDIDRSGGERLGVGHAAEGAIKAYLDATKLRTKLTRQEFMEIVTGEHRFTETAKHCLDKASKSQVKDILDEISRRVQEDLGGDVDDIIIFGGGSITFKEEMHDTLIEFAETFSIRVLWVNEKDAPFLNATGLSILNTKVFFPIKE